ncbi:heterokaryon incompatibility protein-domain-containing protein [Coniella lustricola]|uniref:Heterokaryon incompatibility protein-domain-containing protein n=1 Tax=Coniella lustricola TaxID=2025994 RepID=A0A2T2ZWA5_9PEZI|nr:heterokaryon incompatibility protein-domain-containing protein [Coniella lustricola]
MTDLVLDHDQSLGLLLPSQKDFIDNMLLIQEHVVARSNFDGWASHLRFLTCPSHLTHGQLLSRDEITLTLTDKAAYPRETAYIAVSYCWSSSPTGNATRSGPRYMIQTEDSSKSIRPCRAPANILDRVILYALHHKISLFWIDQECIDQEDPQDLAQGVQCMDEVYSRSQYPLGLLCVEIQNSTITQIFERLLNDIEQQPPKRKETSYRWYNDEVDASAIDELTNVLRNIAADRWFSRSWTYQEATCAQNNMEMLVLGRTQPTQGNDLQVPQRDIAFRLSGLYATSNWILNRARKFSKRRTRPEMPGWHVMAQLCFQAWEQKSRRSRPCDYQVASCLQQRGNLVVADRLAITANLLGYARRLDATLVAARISSYSICALGLALLNGSIHPQNCLSMFESSSPTTPSLKVPCGQWRAMKLRELLEGPRSGAGTYGGPRSDEPRLPCISLSLSGLETAGWLWRIDRKVRLPNLQTRYQQLIEQHCSLRPGERSQTALRIAMIAIVDELHGLQFHTLVTTLEACWGVPSPVCEFSTPTCNQPRYNMADDFTSDAFRSQPRVWQTVEQILSQEYLWCGSLDGEDKLRGVFGVDAPCTVFTSSEKTFGDISRPFAAHNFLCFSVSEVPRTSGPDALERSGDAEAAMALYPGPMVAGCWFPAEVPSVRYVFPWAKEKLDGGFLEGEREYGPCDSGRGSQTARSLVSVPPLIPVRRN